MFPRNATQGIDMSHLSPERIAALLDEQPTPAEMSHLALCSACSRERGAYEALAHMSKGALTLGQPLTSWNKLSPVLKRDGVIDTGRGFGRHASNSRVWLQAAAAVLFMAGGIVVGRGTAVRANSNTVATPDGGVAPTASFAS